MSQSSSHQYSREYAKHEIIEMFFEKGLQTRKSRSEYILFAYPIEEKISSEKRDEIEDAVSIDIKRTDGECDHKRQGQINAWFIVNKEGKINSIEIYYKIIILFVKPKLKKTMLTQLLTTFGICWCITLLIGLLGSGIGYKERFVLIKNEIAFRKMFLGSVTGTSLVSICLAGYALYVYLPKIGHCINTLL